MIKLFKYVLMLVAFFVLASCSDNEGSGAGDATVGFEQAKYTYRESEGTVRIPVKFTGEPKSYPIVFDVKATVDPEKGMVDGEPVTLESVAHYPTRKFPLCRKSRSSGFYRGGTEER